MQRQLCRVPRLRWSPCRRASILPNGSFALACDLEPPNCRNPFCAKIDATKVSINDKLVRACLWYFLVAVLPIDEIRIESANTYRGCRRDIERFRFPVIECITSHLHKSPLSRQLTLSTHANFGD